MGKEAIEGVVTVCSILAGVAIIATLVSKNAQTPAVLTAGGSAFSGALSTALSPVTSVQSVGWTGGAPTDLASY